MIKSCHVYSSRAAGRFPGGYEAYWEQPSLLEQLAGTKLRLWLGYSVDLREFAATFGVSVWDIFHFNTETSVCSQLPVDYHSHVGSTFPMTQDELQEVLSQLQVSGDTAKLVIA